MAPDRATHHIPVMNLSDATRTLHEGTQLRDIFPVESLKHVQEMLWVDSDLSDWESDDDELTYLHATGITSRGTSAKTPYANAHDDVCMDPIEHKISQSTCSVSWGGYQKTSLLNNVRSLQQPFMSTERYSVVAQRIWGRLTWSLMLLISWSTVPYASHPDDFPSLSKMWEKLRSRK